MLVKETLYRSDKKRIALYVDKGRRGTLYMSLQEWDRQDDGCETMLMFQSWRATVAQEPCARATKNAVQRFYDAHIGEARKLAEARAKVLEAGETPAEVTP